MRKLIAAGTISLAVAASLLLPTAAEATTVTDIYASPGGTGTACTVVAPCSIYQAKTNARAVAAIGTDDIVVHLFGGTYWMTYTLNLDMTDQPLNGHSLTYENYDSTPPILDSGQAVTGWTLHDATAGIYQASVGTLDFRQIYDGSTRGIRARYPNVTDAATAGPYLPVTSTNTSTVTVPTADLPSLSSYSGVEMVKLDNWRDKHLRIDSVAATSTPGQSEVSFMSPESSNTLFGSFPQPTSYYYLENSYDFIDAAGEWYLDTSSTPHTLYYKPANGLAPADGQVIVPRGQTTMQLYGASITNPMTNIHVKGLTFQHTNWTQPNQYGYVTGQAAIELTTNGNSTIPGAVQMTNVTDSTFVNNTIRDTGAQGLLVFGNTSGITVDHNTVTDTAAGGIYFDSGTAARRTSENQTITNNTVSYVGRDYSDAAGILATFINNSTVSNNDISNGRYSGISMGWSWNDGDTGASNYNTISGNRISNVMTLLDDGADIYTLGKMAGTTISGNYVSSTLRSSWAGPYNVAGIYLDNGSTGKTVEGNVIDNVTASFFAYNPPNHDNYITDNWYNSPLGTIGTLNTVSGNTAVTGSAWPVDAQAVIDNAGVLP